jgi:hypothetical protein
VKQVRIPTLLLAAIALLVVSGIRGIGMLVKKILKARGQ